MASQTIEEEFGHVRCAPDELSAARRLFWTALGTVALAVGVVGLAVPLLPTTPFVLVAAGCYLKGSRRMHRLLVSNRLFGKVLSDYQAGRGVSWQVRMASMTFLWASLLASYLVFDLPTFILPVMVVVGSGVSLHLLRLPFRKP